jgi:ribosomal protein L19
MKENESKKIIEINGVKLEVDLRNSKVVDSFAVGDNIKVLVKGYGDKYQTYPGVIIDFINFKKQPAIVICYLERTYSTTELHFMTITEDVEDVEILPTPAHELKFEKAEVLKKFNREIEEKTNQIADLEAKKKYFIEHFNKYFEDLK